MVYFIFQQAPFTGGEDGIQAIPRGHILGAIDRPVLTFRGRDFDLVVGMFNVLEVWKGMGHDVRGKAIPK